MAIHDPDRETESSQPIIPRWTLGERLKKARNTACLSQEQMAAELRARLWDAPDFKCKDHNTISAWETDARKPEVLIPTLRAWAAICNVVFEWLATGIDPTESVSFLTKCDGPVTYDDAIAVVDEWQSPFPNFEYPPATKTADLSLVS